MSQILKHGDIFYCRSHNGSYREYRFLNIVTNKRKNNCLNCSSRGDRYCCYMNYSPKEDPMDKQSICLKKCINIMYFDREKTLLVKYIENLFEPPINDKLATINNSYRTHMPNTFRNLRYYSTTVSSVLDISDDFRAVFTGTT